MRMLAIVAAIGFAWLLASIVCGIVIGHWIAFGNSTKETEMQITMPHRETGARNGGGVTMSNRKSFTGPLRTYLAAPDITA